MFHFWCSNIWFLRFRATQEAHKILWGWAGSNSSKNSFIGCLQYPRHCLKDTIWSYSINLKITLRGRSYHQWIFTEKIEKQRVIYLIEAITVGLLQLMTELRWFSSNEGMGWRDSVDCYPIIVFINNFLQCFILLHVCLCIYVFDIY